MTYKETLDFIFSSLPQFQRVGAVAYKDNLDNSNELDEHLNRPHEQFKTIHVAGTNGKGSVSTMIQSVLVRAGYKVGLYTSPHLTDFRERITINGQMMPENAVVDFVTNNKNIIAKLKPSFFEMSVAMAFDYFRNEKVDIAVVEVGMGGRLDSTNIIDPMACVITNISYDHVTFLGDTLEKIAIEKAGIIKPATPVVVGESDEFISAVFDEKAKKENAPIYYAERRFNAWNDPDNLELIVVQDMKNDRVTKFNLTLKGDCQKKNIVTALALIDTIKEQMNISDVDIKQGLEEANIRGRWYVVGNEPTVICDIAHNVAGIEGIVKQIKKQSYSELYMVIGVVSDKDVREMLKLLPREAHYIFTQASVERAMKFDELQRIALEVGVDGFATATVEEAYKQVIKMAKKEDLIFVGGSTFVVADLLEFIDK